MSETSPTICWETTALTIDIVQNEAGAICVRSILPARAKAQKSASLLIKSSELPLVSVKLAGEVTIRLSIYGAIPVLRSLATITNECQDTKITVTQLSSIAVGGLTTKSKEWYHDYTLLTATNS
ncbi:Aldolase-type TIM barrel [Penicillium cf. griseofulvum]|uniref:Aldolase-type TIM barrel n=1 Tax=Penicillium cf. griseofulvum TaxID=2972120 RepID=A0A9W9M102_9EURO|nr:Aldolase-type TIM barrel [Penicillium cf. griseofulvum]KAJ5429540.1 Aldolase-type TIM barrel [Penicillium cf. griseofulvum]KAJ5436680.1 Aldolase-type TIM barrel [Penicillium cf. griseofulvum]